MLVYVLGFIEKCLSFSAILSEYFDIFLIFCEPHSKNDKNPNLTIKNSSLYKFKFIIALPLYF